jgi:hypothetical protein
VRALAWRLEVDLYVLDRDVDRLARPLDQVGA